MECAKIRDELELYAAGGCVPSRREEIEAHARACSSCAKDLADASEFVRMLDKDIKEVAPSIERRRTTAAPRRLQLPRWGWAVLQGGMASIAVAFLLYYFLSRESASEAWAGPNLSAQVTGPSELKLKWTRSEQSVREYLIERGTDEKHFIEISRIGAGVTNFVDGQLATGTTYYYRVGAITDNGSLDFSNIASVRMGPLNMSTRGYVGKNDDRMIAGILIGGLKERKVLIRARGPTLEDTGVRRVLADPTIELRLNGVAIARNDNWQTYDPLGERNGYRCGLPEDIAVAGLEPKGTNQWLESAMIITLPPGAYAAVVEGADGGTGVGLVEIFEIE